jgi:hypothetical protein
VSCGDGDSVTPPGESREQELERLREELRLCRLELAQARAAQEDALERQSAVRRSKLKAEKQAEVLAQALSDVLIRQARSRARAAWWRVADAPRISRREWQQVQLLRESKFFRPAWSLRENLDVAQSGVEPALHFLRDGYREGRDPGPKFSLRRYMDKHPLLEGSRVNPLIHALENGTTRLGTKSAGS